MGYALCTQFGEKRNVQMMVHFPCGALVINMHFLQILVIKTRNLSVVASFRLTTGTSNTTAVKSIEFARRGK